VTTTKTFRSSASARPRRGITAARKSPQVRGGFAITFHQRVGQAVSPAEFHIHAELSTPNGNVSRPVKEESLANGDGFAGMSLSNFFAGPQPGDAPVQVIFGKDSNVEFFQETDNLGPELPQNRQRFVVDHFPVVFLQVHLSPIQAENVGFDIGLEPRSIFEYLHLVKLDHGERSNEGYPHGATNFALTSKPPLNAFFIWFEGVGLEPETVIERG
jgi:hypothetical protein